MIHEFFAVTRSLSVYRVSDNRADDGTPIVYKIGSNGERLAESGQNFQGGRFVGVGSRICLYNMPDEQARTPFEELDSDAWWGGRTSDVLALFLNEEEAIRCSGTVSQNSIDPRLQEQTRKVLQRIGDEHPLFIVSRDHQKSSVSEQEKSFYRKA